MIKEVYVCDLCLGGDGTIRLANGEYFSEETGEFHHSCPTHTKKIKGYDIEVREIDNV